MHHPFSFQHLPRDLAVHVLGFLGELDDLVNTAATCADLHDLVWRHWRVLQPPRSAFHRRFWGGLRGAPQGYMSQRLAEIAEVRRSPDDPMRPLHEATHAANVAANAGRPLEGTLVRTMHFRTGVAQRLPLRDDDVVHPFPPRPTNIHWAVRSLRVISPGNKMPQLQVSGGGINVLGGMRHSGNWDDYDAVPPRFFTAPDGSLELMSFLNHLFFAFYTHHHLWLTCFADTVVVLEEFPLPVPLPGAAFRGRWLMHSTQTIRGRETPSLGPNGRLSLLLTPEGVAEYIAVYFCARSDPDTWLPVQVRQFTLETLAPSWSQDTKVPGWACRHSDPDRFHYRIPLHGRVDFCRVETTILHLDPAPPDVAEWRVHVVALTANEMVYSQGMMGAVSYA